MILVLSIGPKIVGVVHKWRLGVDQVAHPSDYEYDKCTTCAYDKVMRGLSLQSVGRRRAPRLLFLRPRIGLRWASTLERKSRAEGIKVESLTAKWQPHWDRLSSQWHDLRESDRGNAYVLPMFPYPSGTLHLGTCAYTRYPMFSPDTSICRATRSCTPSDGMHLACRLRMQRSSEGYIRRNGRCKISIL